MKTALAGVVAATPVLVSMPAHAATPHHGVLAKYHGKTLDLSRGWQGAQACAQIAAGDVECFDSSSAMHAAVDDAVRAAARDGTAQAIAADCGGIGRLVQLFSGTNWSGRELDFVDTAGWSNLGDYGFDNAMQSWSNQKSCNALLADGANGGGDWLTLGAQSWSLNAGSWKNKASSAYVLF